MELYCIRAIHSTSVCLTATTVQCVPTNFSLLSPDRLVKVVRHLVSFSPHTNHPPYPTPRAHPCKGVKSLGFRV